MRSGFDWFYKAKIVNKTSEQFMNSSNQKRTEKVKKWETIIMNRVNS